MLALMHPVSFLNGETKAFLYVIHPNIIIPCPLSHK